MLWDWLRELRSWLGGAQCAASVCAHLVQRRACDVDVPAQQQLRRVAAQAPERRRREAERAGQGDEGGGQGRAGARAEAEGGGDSTAGAAGGAAEGRVVSARHHAPPRHAHTAASLECLPSSGAAAARTPRCTACTSAERWLPAAAVYACVPQPLHAPQGERGHDAPHAHRPSDGHHPTAKQPNSPPSSFAAPHARSHR